MGPATVHYRRSILTDLGSMLIRFGTKFDISFDPQGASPRKPNLSSPDKGPHQLPLGLPNPNLTLPHLSFWGSVFTVGPVYSDLGAPGPSHCQSLVTRTRLGNPGPVTRELPGYKIITRIQVILTENMKKNTFLDQNIFFGDDSRRRPIFSSKKCFF